MRIESLNNQPLDYAANQNTLLKVGLKVVAYMLAIGFAVLSLIKVYDDDQEENLPSLSTLSGFSLASFLAFKYLS